MQTEVMVALIGAAATIVAALLGLWGTRREGRLLIPAMIGVLTLAIIGTLGIWAYQSSQRPAGKDTKDTPAVTYPATNAAYAEELLGAWARRDTARMTELTTAGALAQLSAIPGSPNPAWAKKSCGQDCTYLNDDGDVITISIRPGGVGKSQAVTQVKFDPTVFPKKSDDYVRAFIDAWKSENLPRQRRLATDNALKQLGGMKAPLSYTLSTDGAMGHLYVTADGGGVSITFDIQSQTVSQARPQAIIGIQVG